MTKKEMIAELKAANWIGEDGKMATISSSKLGAWRKFKKKMLDEFIDIDKISIDDVQIGWAYLTTEADKKEFPGIEDCEWYVNCKNPKIKGVKGVKVWVLNI